jgi:hypothetical protein
MVSRQKREQRKADEHKRAPRNVDEANFELRVADEVLGENDDPMRDRYQVRDGITRAEGHDTTRVYNPQKKKWVNKRAESFITAAHKIAPPPPKRSEPLPPDPTPGRRREPSSIFVDRFEPPKDIHREIEDALERHDINRERIAWVFRGGRPNEARARARRLLREALLPLWGKGRSAKLMAEDLGCTEPALRTLMGNAPRKNL